MSSGVNGYNWNSNTNKILYNQINTNSGALNKEEGVDEDELRRSGKYNEEAFKAADTDGSGVLTAAEFENYMALYNSSTITTPTSTTTTTTTPTTNSTDAVVDELLAIYDKNGNGQWDIDEVINYWNDSKSSNSTVDQTATEGTTTDPTAPETEDTTSASTALTSRILEISTYIAESAVNTSHELGMRLALEFVGDNVDLKGEVVTKLKDAATEYINANPDNENAVEDFKKNVLMDKYNEIKTEVLADSPAQKKEEAIDIAYVLISGCIPENISDELKAAVEKELKAQLMAEANRYAKAYDGDDLKKDLADHLQNYFTKEDSVTLKKAINDFKTEVDKLYSYNEGGVIGADNDWGALNSAAMDFLTTALKEGIAITLAGKTVTESNKYAIIMSFKSSEELKDAIDACIKDIEKSGTKIENIINTCMDKLAEEILKDKGFSTNESQINTGLNTLSTQIKNLSDTSYDLTKATTAYDTINELLYSYSYKEKDGNTIDTQVGKLEYILSLMKQALAEIKDKVGESCTKYTAAKTKCDELESKITEAKEDKDEYKTSYLEDQKNKVAYNEFVNKLSKGTSNYITVSASTSSIPTDIKNSNDYATPMTYSGDRTTIVGNAKTVLNKVKKAAEAQFRNVLDTLPEPYKTDVSAKADVILQNVFDAVAFKVINGTVITGNETDGYSFKADKLIEEFWKQYNGDREPSLKYTMKNYYASETDFDTETIDYSSLRSTITGWYDNSISQKYNNKDSIANTHINSSGIKDQLKTKVKNILGERYNEDVFNTYYNETIDEAFNQAGRNGDESGYYEFNIRDYVTTFVKIFEDKYNTYIKKLS